MSSRAGVGGMAYQNIRSYDVSTGVIGRIEQNGYLVARDDPSWLDIVWSSYIRTCTLSFIEI